MPPSSILMCIPTFAALASAGLGQTFIVDAANGPGTNFIDIATASATVPDGSVLEVRAGSYASFAIVSKGLSVRCAPGVSVAGIPPIAVSGTASGQTVELRGLQVSEQLSLNSCQGPVLLYSCNVTGMAPGALQVTGCQQVYADTCSFASQPYAAIILINSAAVLQNCGAWTQMVPGISMQASSLQLTDCIVSAGTVVSTAVTLANADVRIIGGSLRTHFGVSGTGGARIDPSVTFLFSVPQPFVGSVVGSIVEMPAVVATGGALGGSLTVAMRGPGGHAGALLAGWPGTPLGLPGILDPGWLRPGSESVCFVTIFAPGIPALVVLPVPNVPAFRGLRTAWQGLSYGATGLQASTPAIASHW